MASVIKTVTRVSVLENNGIFMDDLIFGLDLAKIQFCTGEANFCPWLESPVESHGLPEWETTIIGLDRPK